MKMNNKTSHSDTTKKSRNEEPFEALQIEYSSMASWYDSFWADYLNQTFRLPLKLLLKAIRVIEQQQQCRSGVDQHRDHVVVVDVACGTGEFVNRVQQRLAEEDDDELNDRTDIKDDDAQQREQRRKQQKADPGNRRIAFYGIEPCPEMIAEARKKTDNNNNKTTTNTTTEWIQSTAEALSLPTESAHAITSTNAFHFFRNKPLALTQMYRCLKSSSSSGAGGDGDDYCDGGKLIITDWCADYWVVRFYHCFEILRWNVFGGKHDRYPNPLPSRVMEQLVQDAGFVNVKIETYTVRFWMIVFWGMQTITANKP